ncbi:hypothetical protein LSAT2_025809 [Lamellibrachia satsuma]|nr:hypothetical protein LSAT2_025809 [Lamellibrachia satsuma]
MTTPKSFMTVTNQILCCAIPTLLVRGYKATRRAQSEQAVWSFTMTFRLNVQDSVSFFSDLVSNASVDRRAVKSSFKKMFISRFFHFFPEDTGGKQENIVLRKKRSTLRDSNLRTLPTRPRKPFPARFVFAYM